MGPGGEWRKTQGRLTIRLATRLRIRLTTRLTINQAQANPRGATMGIIGPLSPTVALVTKLVAKPDEADEVCAFLGLPC